MTNTTQKRNKQCIRGQCKEFVYTKDYYAKQCGLCKKHFTYFKNKYISCNFCHLWISKKSSIYCDNKCKTLEKICSSPLFKRFDSAVSKVLFDMRTTNQMILLEMNLKDIFIEYLQIEQIQNTDYLKNIAIINQQKYISTLKMSFCHSYTNILGLFYFSVPSIILDEINVNGLLLKYLKQLDDKNLFIDIFKIKEKSYYELLNSTLDHSKKLSYSFAVCYSNDEPYYKHPILAILKEFIEEYCVSEHLNFDEEYNKNNLLKAIDNINNLPNSALDCDKASEMHHIYIEIGALILLYCLVFYNHSSCKKIFKELSILFTAKQDIVFYNAVRHYFILYFGNKASTNKNHGPDRDNHYKDFYKSLFIHYKQAIPTNKT